MSRRNALPLMTFATGVLCVVLGLTWHLQGGTTSLVVLLGVVGASKIIAIAMAARHGLEDR